MLYIYDAQVPINARLVDNFDASQVIAASFVPNDETKLWLLNEQGVVQYDLLTDETLILESEFKSTNYITGVWFGLPIFSPNGHYLATFGSDGIYLVDLTRYIPANGEDTGKIISIAINDSH